MKKFLVAVAALACMGSVALAGPNANGTIFLQDANTVYTTDIASYCGMGAAPTTCAGADTVIDVSGSTQMVFKVYSAFPDGSSPRLKGLSFGIRYDTPVVLSAWGPCIGDLNNGAAEFPGAGWPGSNTGTAIVWQFTQTTQLVECYWFAGYDYYGTAACVTLRDNPDPNLGGYFGDDSVPPLLDPIAGYGALGFNTTCSSTHRCPGGPPPPLEGACCIGTTCIITTEANCVGQGGVYQGDNTLCDPNPCLPPTGACCIGETCIVTDRTTCEGQGGIYQGDNVPCDPNPCAVPVQESTWGQIKANYR